VVAIRNATHEKGYGFIVIPGLPVGGHEISNHQISFNLDLKTPGNFLQEMVQSDEFPVIVDHPNVRINAVKPAWRGKGWIVRLEAFQPPKKPIHLFLRHGKIKKAVFCDARERDIQDLKVQKGKAIVKMPRSIATVRILA
jgi:alpha-mannosidase